MCERVQRKGWCGQRLPEEVGSEDVEPGPATRKGCLSPEKGSQWVLPGAGRVPQGPDPTQWEEPGHRIWSVSESQARCLGTGK